MVGSLSKKKTKGKAAPKRKPGTQSKKNLTSPKRVPATGESRGRSDKEAVEAHREWVNALESMVENLPKNKLKPNAHVGFGDPDEPIVAAHHKRRGTDNVIKRLYSQGNYYGAFHRAKSEYHRLVSAYSKTHASKSSKNKNQNAVKGRNRSREEAKNAYQMWDSALKLLTETIDEGKLKRGAWDDDPVSSIIDEHQESKYTKKVFDDLFGQDNYYGAYHHARAAYHRLAWAASRTGKKLKYVR